MSIVLQAPSFLLIGQCQLLLCPPRRKPMSLFSRQNPASNEKTWRLMNECFQLTFGISTFPSILGLRFQLLCTVLLVVILSWHEHTVPFFSIFFLLPPVGIVYTSLSLSWLVDGPQELVPLNLEMTSLTINFSPTPSPRQLQGLCLYVNIIIAYVVWCISLLSIWKLIYTVACMPVYSFVLACVYKLMCSLMWMDMYVYVCVLSNESQRTTLSIIP